MKNIKLTKQKIEVLNKIDKGEITSITQLSSSTNINFLNYISCDITM